MVIALQRRAHWSDVRAKAKRLRTGGGVTVHVRDRNRIEASVQGDTDTYDVILERSNVEDLKITGWSCDCPWGQWAFNRERFYGRFCSHAYAALLETWSQHMKEVLND